MLKKAMAAAAVAASVMGVSAAVAPQALAIGNDTGTTSFSGNGATEAFGNNVTNGDLSPQATLVQSSLNKLCVGLPVKANVQSVLALVNVGVQDIPVLSSPQNQQCAENSTQAKNDEPLSHLVDDVSVLAGNGVANN
ncbi:RdlA protein [Streptomyces sp. SID2999]|uniref:RdlA protein n=1 Tax=Streptomyces seoulensis TaxID=73044 RepID=A0A4P6TV44_STRSO|nr:MULTISPECIES: rodlin [Streptomyces]MYZ06011.1 RdlA protein [Streptomyces sp. SID2999]QBJ90612.1 RdlA protein [Streptomyces seoulensis]